MGEKVSGHAQKASKQPSEQIQPPTPRDWELLQEGEGQRGKILQYNHKMYLFELKWVARHSPVLTNNFQ